MLESYNIIGFVIVQPTIVVSYYISNTYGEANDIR